MIGQKSQNVLGLGGLGKKDTYSYLGDDIYYINEYTDRKGEITLRKRGRGRVKDSEYEEKYEPGKVEAIELDDIDIGGVDNRDEGVEFGTDGDGEINSEEEDGEINDKENIGDSSDGKEPEDKKGRFSNLLGKLNLGEMVKEEFDLGSSFLTDFEQGNFTQAFIEIEKLIILERGQDIWTAELEDSGVNFHEDLQRAEEGYKRFFGELQENFTNFVKKKENAVSNKINVGRRINDFAIIIPANQNQSEHVTMEKLMMNILEMAVKPQFRNLLITPIPIYLDKETGEGVIIVSYGGGWNVRLIDFMKSVKLTKKDMEHISISEFSTRIELRLRWIVIIRQLKMKYKLVSDGEDVSWAIIQAIFIYQRYEFSVKEDEILVLDNENPSEEQEDETIKAEWDTEDVGENKSESKIETNGTSEDLGGGNNLDDGGQEGEENNQEEDKEPEEEDRPPLTAKKLRGKKENEVHPGYSFD